MKHKELILAALNGATLEWRRVPGARAGNIKAEETDWRVFPDPGTAIRVMTMEYRYEEYRIQPKPDYVKYRVMNAANKCWDDYAEEQKFLILSGDKPDQFKITYDGETDEIKKIELVE